MELLECVQHRKLLRMTTAQVEVEQAGGYALLHIGGIVGDGKLGEICSHLELLVDNAVDDLLDGLAGVVPIKRLAGRCPSVEFVSVSIMMMAMIFKIVLLRIVYYVNKFYLCSRKCLSTKWEVRLI